MVVKVSLYYCSQPAALLWHWLMSYVPKLLTDFFYFPSDTLGYGFALYRKPSIFLLSGTNVRETKKVEGLWFSLASALSVLYCKATIFDEASLCSAHLQSELCKPGGFAGRLFVNQYEYVSPYVLKLSCLPRL